MSWRAGAGTAGSSADSDTPVTMAKLYNANPPRLPRTEANQVSGMARRLREVTETVAVPATCPGVEMRAAPPGQDSYQHGQFHRGHHRTGQQPPGPGRRSRAGGDGDQGEPGRGTPGTAGDDGERLDRGSHSKMVSVLAMTSSAVIETGLAAKVC